MLRAVVGVIALGTAAPAVAQSVPTADGFVRFVFQGVVTSSIDESVTVRNRDGSTETFTGDAVPDYRFERGDAFASTLTFQAPGAAAQAQCGGTFALTTASQATGPCALVAQVETPFGRRGFGGSGGDNPGRLVGLNAVLDPATGGFTLATPTGAFSASYFGVNPIYYDSAAKALSGPTGNICVDSFNCPQGTLKGTLTSLDFGPIGIAGDFGKVRPGYNVGYDAGTAGRVVVSGRFVGNREPIEVPEPGVTGLFLLGAAALMWRRRKNVRVAG